MVARKKAPQNIFLKELPTVYKPAAKGLIQASKIPVEKDLPPFIVKGREADSKDEWYVSLALVRFEKANGWYWEYQVPVFGGRSREGGYVLDFIVYTPGRRTIISPMGRPFHTGKRDDRLELEHVARKMNCELIAYFTDEPKVRTKEGVYQYLKKKMYA